MKRVLLSSALALAILLNSCDTKNSNNGGVDPSLTTSTHGIPAPVSIPYTIIAQYPHDTSAYTQGLQYYNGVLYEGTGDYENSSLRKTELQSGKVLELHIMGSEDIFGEGITILNDTLYQLTWTNNIVYVYTLKDLSKPIKTIKWPYEGWGITNNGKELILSDGSSNLYFVDPTTFQLLNTVRVADNNGSVKALNELEYIDGYVYANVYLTYDIVKIDPESGHVKGRMRFDQLLSNAEKTHRTDVLNGIAWDAEKQVMLITGKRWPKMFELKMH